MPALVTIELTARPPLVSVKNPAPEIATEVFCDVPVNSRMPESTLRKPPPPNVPDTRTNPDPEMVTSPSRVPEIVPPCRVAPLLVVRAPVPVRTLPPPV